MSAYTGQLEWESESENINVISFVERPDHFRLRWSTTWGLEGTFVVDEEAHKRGASFSTGTVYARTRFDTVSNVASTITFQIVGRTPTSISIRGTWAESDESHRFAGTLKKTAIGEDAESAAVRK